MGGVKAREAAVARTPAMQRNAEAAAAQPLGAPLDFTDLRLVEVDFGRALGAGLGLERRPAVEAA